MKKDKSNIKRGKCSSFEKLSRDADEEFDVKGTSCEKYSFKII